VRGHVSGYQSHVPMKTHLSGLRLEQVRTSRMKETFGAVARMVSEAREPWLAEASQNRHPRRCHLLEDNPSSG
jgi:hypothetical protein